MDGQVKTHAPLNVSTSQRELLSNENSQSDGPEWLKPLNSDNLGFPSAKFHQIVDRRDEFSRTVPSSSPLQLRQRITKLFSRKLDWPAIRKMCKEWFKNPLNILLFIWIVCVAVSSVTMLLLMTGVLNHALPKKSQRDTWNEVINQILNALFTLLCLYQHPQRISHFNLLLRWRPEDISRLRKAYCKNETYKPHEWTHMMVVVVLLNLNCFAQYALCGLNWGYKRSERPATVVGICLLVAVLAPAIAGVYCTHSPLGKDYDTELDEESQVQKIAAESSSASQPRRIPLEKRFSFASDKGRVVETRPQWSGGILDFWDDISLAYLSLFCSFCVFGWNMERLGFGNMYVHIATFLLFCMAPFWIFNLAAVNTDSDTVKRVLGVTGIFLSLFGLLYGGFWRIRMRKRYNLPPYNTCCGKPYVVDCALWLFCCYCSLAQEVRTGNSYDIVEDTFRRKDENISPLPREDGRYEYTSGPPLPTIKTSTSSPSRFADEIPSPDRHEQLFVEDESHTKGQNVIMIPPTPSVIQREDDNLNHKL
ncbi:hypothetical protein MTR67_027160 [Solanum verrucosum]|uniref:PLAC8 motif-containing protein n=1 Tax=Solanum verrucosum TaxID=315347 RepID=A0AAF0TZH0_SOLVR|nr:hypothetical protein MTR67_027160 [Solanum verrucosum]